MRDMHPAEGRSGNQSILVRIFAVLALTFALSVLHPLTPVHAAPVSPSAINVYGQGGSFNTTTPNKGGISATSLNGAGDTTLDSAGNLYISDSLNNRVLFYPKGTTTATRVYGQADYISNQANRGGTPTADTLSAPRSIDLDNNNNLYIADTGNNRVLFYPSGTTTATFVYGQANTTSNQANRGGSVDSNTLSGPRGLELGENNSNLYISDSGNNRVVVYSIGNLFASTVYGQANFTSRQANRGGSPNTNTLSSPRLTELDDNNNNLYIADTGNSRILVFTIGNSAAKVVYGQGGNFTTGTANKGGISADSLSNPQGVTIDENSNVYIADTANNRVLFYLSGSTTATRVYGQGGSFTTANNGGEEGGSISSTSLNQPSGFELNDNGGDIYVADINNDRILQFLNILNVSTQPPTSVAANTQFTVTTTLLDLGSGSAFSDFNNTVSIQISPGSGTAGAILSGTTSVRAVAGVATFSNLSIDKAGICYILTLTSPNTASTQTIQFSVTSVVTPTTCTITAGHTTCTLKTCLAINAGSITVTGAPTLIANHGQAIPVIAQDQFIPFSFLGMVIDTRGNGHGWTTAVTATSIQFPAGGGSASLTLSSLFPIIVTCAGGGSCSSVSSLTINVGGLTLSSSTPTTLATASYGYGLGAYNIGVNGTFLVPANVNANGYTGGVITMTITANP